MKNRNTACIICLIIILSNTLSACTPWSPEPQETVESPEDQLVTLFSEAELDYEVPISTPNILVNELGYLPNREKMAVFRGENLPETFQIIDAMSGQAVWEGKIEDQGYNTDTGEHNSYGTFTELKSPGTYYVEASIVGRSYTFTISDGLYDAIFRSACKQYYYNRCGISLHEDFAGDYAHNACHTQKVPLREDATVSLDVSGGWHQDASGSKDTSSACKVINSMLLAYELNKDFFTDDMEIPESGNAVPDLLDEINYEISWLLKMQDSITGGAYSGVTVYQSSSETGPLSPYTAYVEPVSLEATAMYCAVMAKFGYLYQDYDTTYATECLKAADRAWRYLENNPAAETDAKEMEGLIFMAATEMYRAAGYNAYHRIITQYLNNHEYQENLNENIIMGGVTYLSTKKRVDRNLCSEIMKVLMDKAEAIAEASSKSQYLTAGNRKQDNNVELLEAMVYLSIVNHIIKNHEYGTVIENHLHYFMGRNSGGISYIDGIGAKNYQSVSSGLGIMNQIGPNSRLIFMISEIKSNEHLNK